MDSKILVTGLLLLTVSVSRIDGRSLAAVIDTTGSMTDDIAQVKSSANAILTTALSSTSSGITNFVLVPFRDPCE